MRDTRLDQDTQPDALAGVTHEPEDDMTTHGTMETTETPAETAVSGQRAVAAADALPLHRSRRRLILVIAAAVVIVGAGAGYAYHKLRHSGAPLASVSPQSITPAPAGLIAGTSPDSAGKLWVLVNQNGRANVQAVKTSDASPSTAFPMSNEATSVAWNYANVLGVGLGSGGSGAVQLYASGNMSLIGTVPLAGPVVSLTPSDNGSDFYALVHAGAAVSASVVDITTRKVVNTIPLPSLTDSIALSPDQTTLYALQGNGTVSVIAVSSKQVLQQFPITPGDRQIALSPDGSTLYVLKGSQASDNVAVVDLATQTTSYVLPAPAFTQGLVVAPGGNLYDLVGTAQYGNVQVFRPAK